MGGVYFGGSAGGGIFGGGSAPEPQEHHSLLHRVVHATGSVTKHLLSDVKTAALGLPAGLVLTAEHPIRSVKAMATSTWADWSPLFHGHVGEFAHNFEEHPLAPLLDVSAFVTGGAGLAAKGAELATRAEFNAAAEAGQLGGLSKLAKLGRPQTELLRKADEPVALEKHLSANPAVRLRQRATQRLGEQLAQVFPNGLSRLSKDGQYDRALLHDRSTRGVATSHIRAAVTSAVGSMFDAGRKIGADPYQVYGLIEPHMREGLIANARESEAEAKLGRSSKWRYVKAETPKTMHVDSPERLQEALRSFGARHTTTDPADALRGPSGKLLVVANHHVKLYGEEGARAAGFLHKLAYSKPTQVWKWLILATRPAFLVNNAVGNTFMSLAALGPHGFVRGMVDATRQVHGEKAAIAGLEGADRVAARAAGSGQDVIDRYYMGPHREGFSTDVLNDQRLHVKLKEKGLPDRLVPVVKHAEQGFYPLTHKIAENFMRRIGINELLRRSPEVKAAMANGRSFARAVTKASEEPAFRSRIQHQMDDILGQYHFLSPTEKSVRQLVPFYTWDRAILRHGVHIALDKPASADVLEHAGTEGADDTRAKLGGNIPDFLQAVLPLGKSGDGRLKVLSTTGLNPYASLPDVLDAAGSAVGVGDGTPGDALASQVNPIITSLIESATGQSLLSGAKLPERPGGLIGQTAANLTESIPLVKLIETLVKGEQTPKPNTRTGRTKRFLYRKDARTQIAALLGVPVKELDESVASALADKQNHVRRGRKSHAGIYG